MRSKSESEYSRKKREAERQQDGERSNSELVAALNRALAELRLARDLEEGFQKGKNFRDWLTLIIVSIAAVLFVRQWLSMKDQQALMQKQMDQMQAGQRPWISSSLSVAGPMVFDGTHASVTVKTTLENTGNTPAGNISFQPQIVAQHKTMPFNAADILENRCPTPTWRTDMAYGDTLFKDQTIDRAITAIADKKTLGAHEGDALLLVDCVYYQLPGGEIRETANFYLLAGIVWRDRKDTIPRESITLYPQGSFAK